ncbi:MAG: hypothetical protein ABIV06_07675, partial [Thermoanaerobaculia bacterium]
AGSRESKSVDCTFAADLESSLAGVASSKAVMELPTTYEFSSMQADGTWLVERSGHVVFGLFVEEPVTNALNGCLRLFRREEGFGVGVARGCEPEDFDEMLKRASCPTGDCPKGR